MTNLFHFDAVNLHIAVFIFNVLNRIYNILPISIQNWFQFSWNWHIRISICNCFTVFVLYGLTTLLFLFAIVFRRCSTIQNKRKNCQSWTPCILQQRDSNNCSLNKMFRNDYPSSRERPTWDSISHTSVITLI